MSEEILLTPDQAIILKIPRDKWRVNSSTVKQQLMMLDGFQFIFKDRLDNFDFDLAIVDACLDFNDLPPRTPYTPVDFPDRGLLLDMSKYYTLNRLVMFHANNNFTGNSAGVTINPHETRLQAFSQLTAKWKAEVDQRAYRLKKMINNNSMFGFIGGLGYITDNTAYNRTNVI